MPKNPNASAGYPDGSAFFNHSITAQLYEEKQMPSQDLHREPPLRGIDRANHNQPPAQPY